MTEHETRIEHDGFAFYFWCQCGVPHTANAFDRLLEAIDAADHHGATDEPALAVRTA